MATQVYEVLLERACAGGGCATFFFMFVFSMFFFFYFRGGHPRPPRGTQRGAPGVRQQVFGFAFLAAFCRLRCEPMRSTITINTYTKKNK